MNEVTAYMTQDGKLFTDRAEAVVHEREYILKENVIAFVNKHGYSGMDCDDVCSIIFENLEEFRNILINE